MPSIRGMHVELMMNNVLSIHQHSIKIMSSKIARIKSHRWLLTRVTVMNEIYLRINMNSYSLQYLI